LAIVCDYQNKKRKETMEDIHTTIEIPSDADGFVLLQCPLCSEFFKITPEDFESDELLKLCCPNCGIQSDDFLTDEVLEVAQRVVENMARDLLEKKTKEIFSGMEKSGFKVSSSGSSPRNSVDPIKPSIENLEITDFSCCKKQAKIRPILRLSSHYCPFCGGNYYGSN
jgi:Zn finger protein HypA/HybF involved in hydrogenase expression